MIRLLASFLASSALLGVALAGDDPDPIQKEECDKILKGLKAKDSKSRILAADHAKKIGKLAAPIARELCELLADPNVKVATAALEATERVIPDLYPKLATYLIDNQATKRFEALREIGELGEAGRPACGLFLARLKHYAAEPKADVNTEGSVLFVVIEKLAPDDADSIKALKLLAGPTVKMPAYRTASLTILKQWAGREEDRQKELIPLLKSGLESAPLAVQCCQLAGEFKGVSEELLPAIKKLKLSPNFEVREAARKAVDQIEGN